SRNPSRRRSPPPGKLSVQSFLDFDAGTTVEDFDQVANCAVEEVIGVSPSFLPALAPSPSSKPHLRNELPPSRVSRKTRSTPPRTGAAFRRRSCRLRSPFVEILRNRRGPFSRGGRSFQRLPRPCRCY